MQRKDGRAGSEAANGRSRRVRGRMGAGGPGAAGGVDARVRVVPASEGGAGELRGIAIADGGKGAGATERPPRIAAFIWAERDESQPTLPFGRWRAAS